MWVIGVPYSLATARDCEKHGKEIPSFIPSFLCRRYAARVFRKRALRGNTSWGMDLLITLFPPVYVSILTSVFNHTFMMVYAFCFKFSVMRDSGSRFLFIYYNQVPFELCCLLFIPAFNERYVFFCIGLLPNCLSL